MSGHIEILGNAIGMQATFLCEVKITYFDFGYVSFINSSIPFLHYKALMMAN